MFYQRHALGYHKFPVYLQKAIKNYSQAAIKEAVLFPEAAYLSPPSPSGKASPNKTNNRVDNANEQT